MGTAPDGSPAVDAAQQDATTPRPDARADASGPPACEAPALAMGFVWQSALPPDRPTPDTEEFEWIGRVTYHGAVTVPIAQSPAFDREVQLEHADGQQSILQYFLPRGIRLPVAVSDEAVFFLRRRSGPDGEGVGIVVSRPTSGLPPLLFVGDAGPRRVFDPEDGRISPLKVYVESRPGCAPLPDPACGGQRVPTQLRFDSSTGGVVTAVTVFQGEMAELPIFGEPFRVLDLESFFRDPGCPDMPGERAVYLAVTASAAADCDPDRFWTWNTPVPDLGVGDWCDEIAVCLAPEQIPAAQAAAPDLECNGVVGAPCQPGESECRLPSPNPITAETYAQMCALSVLPDPPERIECRVYFD